MFSYSVRLIDHELGKITRPSNFNVISNPQKSLQRRSLSAQESAREKTSLAGTVSFENLFRIHNYIKIKDKSRALKKLPEKGWSILNVYLKCLTLEFLIAANAWWTWSLVTFVKWRVATDGIWKSTWWANIGVSVGIVCYAVSKMVGERVRMNNSTSIPECSFLIVARVPARTSDMALHHCRRSRRFSGWIRWLVLSW